MDAIVKRLMENRYDDLRDDPRMSINLRAQLTDADIEELLNDYAGAVSYSDGWIYGDETTIRQIRNNWSLDEAFTPDTNKGDKGFGSSKSFKAGDVCIYHYNAISGDVPEETIDYYKSKDGAYCVVYQNDTYNGFVQIKFISDMILNDPRHSGAECYPEDLEKVGR